MADITLDEGALKAASYARCWALEQASRRSMTGLCKCTGECEEPDIETDEYLRIAITAYLGAVSHSPRADMPEEVKHAVKTVLKLDKEATQEPWDCKPDPERENDSPDNWRYEDENSGSMTTAVRPFGASVENTIAECWGTEHDDQANARLIAYFRSAAPLLARHLLHLSQTKETK